ncbi:MAG: FprA family A-type flavoprotein, partial [Lachnospiraceae bacterium]|nr:FprA family A-type flavoprotein [Lachnospiraceae bacterium]
VDPDHAGSVSRIMELFPEMVLVGNQKTFLFLSQFIEESFEGRTLVVKEGDVLSLGEHRLSFYMATMVHWPEVMMSYETKEKILFSADAFGKFGALELTENADWACEARRYYFNIVGKYGVAVQAVLKKLSVLEIAIICPLHGPVLMGNLQEYIRLYDIWSAYEPETKGVLVAYASIHGNTALAAERFAEILRENGEEKVVVTDLSRADISEAVEDAFRYDRMVVAAASYDAGVFPRMRDFLLLLQSKNYQKRKVGIIENGTWSPSAGRTMQGIFEDMKNIELAEPMVTLHSTMKEKDLIALKMLAEALVRK